MNKLKVKATGYDLDGYPGWVKFTFRDVNNKDWILTEKLPVVGLDFPEDENDIPFYFHVEVNILESYQNKNGSEIRTVQFLYDIESDDGETIFDVDKSQF